MERRRIIIITHEFFPFPGGIAVYVREMAQALVAEGFEVEVWCPADAELSRHKWQFAVLPLDNRGTQSWLDRLATARVWRARARDVRDATLWLADPGAMLAGFYDFIFRLPAPRRLVLTLHGSEILNFSRSSHRRWLFERMLKRADVVTVLSDFNVRLLQKCARVAPEKIRLAPGAVRSDFADMVDRRAAGGGTAEVAAPVAAAVPVCGVGADVVRVVSVGRIHPRKGQGALLEAAALLPEEIRGRLLLRFAGRVVREEYQKQLEKLAAKAGVQTDFMGEVPDGALPALYTGSDIFALTSLPLPNSIEGFGLVALEAAACGLPALAHDTGGISEAVRDGETGLLAPADDRAALAAALRRLVESPELRRTLGENARRHARGFSWRESARKILAE